MTANKICFHIQGSYSFVDIAFDTADIGNDAGRVDEMCIRDRSLVEEINSYGKKQTDGKLKTSRDNIENSVKENVFDAVNKKVDSSLKEQNIQNRQQVQKILEEYTLDLQRYLDQTVQGEIKASVKEITKENVEKTQKALNSKHASETEQLKQSYEKKLEEQRVSLEGQKALLEEQKNALEEQKTLLEEQKTL